MEYPKCPQKLHPHHQLDKMTNRLQYEFADYLQRFRLLLRDLVDLECGDIVSFEYPAVTPLTMTLNGTEKFRGEMVGSGRRAATVGKRARRYLEQWLMPVEEALHLIDHQPKECLSSTCRRGDVRREEDVRQALDL